MRRLPACIFLVVLPAATACGEASHPAAMATVLVLPGGTETAAFGGSVKADDAARAAADAWVRPGEVVVSAPEIGHSSVDLDESLLQSIFLQAPPRLALPAIASADPQPFGALSRVRSLRRAAIRVLAPPLVPFRLDESLAPGELPGPPKLQPPPVRGRRAFHPRGGGTRDGGA